MDASTDSIDKPKRKRITFMGREWFEARRAAEALRHADQEAAYIAELDAMPDCVGMCYFVGNDEIVKIGYSRNVPKRVSTIKSSSGPYRLNLLATARGGSDRERHYHHLFAEHALGSEWFNMHPDIEAEITRLNEVRS